MKKLRLALLGLCCCFVFEMTAQLSLGVKGGYTEAWENYGDIELPENAPISVYGWNASLLAHYRFNKHFKLGFEPGFVERGAACVPGWQPIFSGDTKFFLDYVSTPIKAYGSLFFLKDRLELCGGLGYGPSLLVSAIREETLFTVERPVTRSNIDLNADSFLNRWDHGMFGSLSLGYHLKFGQLFAEGAYYYGLVDADKGNFSKNRNINLNMGVLIDMFN